MKICSFNEIPKSISRLKVHNFDAVVLTDNLKGVNIKHCSAKPLPNSTGPTPSTIILRDILSAMHYRSMQLQESYLPRILLVHLRVF